MQQTASSKRSKRTGDRLFALDALRGLVIVLMALDHANHFVAQQHSPGEYWGGFLPAYDSELPFLLRLVTHLAAPGFFFLMGAGMTLFAASRARAGWTAMSIRRHFWLRGLLLVVLQFTLINFAWSLSPSGWALDVYVGVLYALGAAMFLCSFFVDAPAWLLLTLSVVLLVVTQTLVPDGHAWGTLPATALQKLLLWPGGDTRLWSSFPLLPWLPLATAGMAYGKLLLVEPQRAWRYALWLGLACLAAFFALRLSGDAGSIRPPRDPGWIAFFNLVKYPPSLTFVLLTMGINLTLLWLFSRAGEVSQRLLRPLIVFGRVPLFFYVTHLYIYLALGLLFTRHGTSQPRMLLYWLLGLGLLYPLCLAYGRFRRSRSPNSAWRLL